PQVPIARFSPISPLLRYWGGSADCIPVPIGETGRVFMGGLSDVCPNSGRPGNSFALHARRGHEFGSGTVRRGSSERGYARAGPLGTRPSRERRRAGPDRARTDDPPARDDRGPV